MASHPHEAFRALAHPERLRLLNALADHNPQSDQSFEYRDDVPGENECRHPRCSKTGFVEWQKAAYEIAKGTNDL